jgi:biotin carboxyl carrier protein
MSNTNLESLVTGRVCKIERQAGDPVRPGDVVLTVESMKMEIPVEATVSGTLVVVSVVEGDAVDEGQIVAQIKPFFPTP